MGPRQIGIAHTRAADELDEDAILQFANCQGEWFDASDVEQYLKTKGLDLSGKGSVSEIEIDMPVPALVEDSTGNSPAGSPVELPSTSGNVSSANLDGSLNHLFNNETSLDLGYFDSTDSNLSMDLGGWPGITNPKSFRDLSRAQPQVRNGTFPNFDFQLSSTQAITKTRKVVIDVDLMIESKSILKRCSLLVKSVNRQPISNYSRLVLHWSISWLS